MKGRNAGPDDVAMMGDLVQRVNWLGAVPPTRGVGPREAAEVVGDELALLALELGPPGLLPVMPILGLHAVFAALVLPLSVVGLVSLGWSDWPLALRLLMGVTGALGAMSCAVLLVWPIVFAAGFRERLVVRDGQVELQWGVLFVVRTRALGSLDTLAVRAATRPAGLRAHLRVPAGRGEHGWCVAFVRDEVVVGHFGSWLDQSLAQRLARRVQDGPKGALQARVEVGASPRQGWRERLAVVLRDPAPIALDGAIGLGLVVFGTWPGALEFLERAYPVAAVLFFATLALKLPRMPRGHGLDASVGRPMPTAFGLSLAGVGVVVGLATVPVFVEGWLPETTSTPMVAVLVALGAACAAAFLVGRRALAAGRDSGVAGMAATRGPAGASPIVDALFFLSLLVLSGVHESWASEWMGDSQRGLGPLSVAMLPTATAILVWPGRFFYQLERPFDDGPRWRFLGLIAMFTLWALFGV